MGDSDSHARIGSSAFVWPPRRDLNHADAALVEGHDVAGSPDQACLAHARAASADAALDGAVADASGVADVGPWLLSIERTWLGLRSPPWSVRAAEARFVADSGPEHCPRCAGSVGPGEVGEFDGHAACSACRDQRLPWARALRLGSFSGVLRGAILEAKYTRWRRLAFDLGRDLGTQLARRLREEGAEVSEFALVPVPMSWRRRWSRGMDHTLEIARGVRREAGMTIERPLRRRHRPVQASLPRGERDRNARGSFAPRGGRRLDGYAGVVVLDDVRTTGATLRAACRALIARERRLGGRLDQDSIWVATVAVPTPPDRREAATGSEGADRQLRGGDDALIL